MICSIIYAIQFNFGFSVWYGLVRGFGQMCSNLYAILYRNSFKIYLITSVDKILVKTLKQSKPLSSK